MAKAKVVDRAKYKPTKVLTNWRRVVRRIPKMTEKEVEACLEAEKEGEKRTDVIFRLARRLTKLRGERQMQEMIK